MSNYNDNKKYVFNDSSYSSRNITHNGKKSPIEDDENKIVDTRPAISRNFSPSGRKIKILQSGQ